MNFEAYAIKKSLPRLIIAVILIQFSFVLCALIIDVGNVLAGGVGDFFAAAVATPGGANGFEKILELMVGALVALTALILLPSALAKIGAVIIIGAVLALFFAVLSVLFTLIVRKLIIYLLIVLSPLAFLAMVLPGTESFFKLWYKNFIRLIMMYPIIVVLFSLGTLLSSVTTPGTSPTDLDKGINNLIAAAFPIIACFMVPMTYKWGGQFMNFASQYTTKAVNAVGNRAKSGWKDSEMAKSIQSRHDSRRHDKLSEDLAGNNGSRARWWAGVKTRGDLFSRYVTDENGVERHQGRSPQVKKGGKWYKPNDWTTTGDRAGVLERQQAIQVQKMEAAQLAELREQYNALSTGELIDRIKQVTSPLHAQAIAGVAVTRGAGDQPVFFGALADKFRDATDTDGNPIFSDTPTGEEARKKAQHAITAARDLAYGKVLETAPQLTTLDLTKGDTISGDGTIVYDANGALGITKRAGDKLAGMTGPGWDTIGKAAVTREALEEVLRDEDGVVADDIKHRVGEFLRIHPEVHTFTSDITVDGFNIGAALVSDAARESIQKSGVLRAKIPSKGVAADVVYGVDHAHDAGGSGRSGGGGGGGDDDDSGGGGGGRSGRSGGGTGGGGAGGGTARRFPVTPSPRGPGSSSSTGNIMDEV